MEKGTLVSGTKLAPGIPGNGEAGWEGSKGVGSAMRCGASADGGAGWGSGADSCSARGGWGCTMLKHVGSGSRLGFGAGGAVRV